MPGLCFVDSICNIILVLEIYNHTFIQKIWRNVYEWN